MMTIVMASGNVGKIREIARLLADLDVEIVPQSDFGVDDAKETGSTFEENAILKARHAVAATGLAAIADDSGLVVDALNGRPGVYSARYAGTDASDEENIDKLLTELNGIDDRGAAFHCVACFVAPDETEAIIATGVWRGEILRERRGDGGFGYDPIFLDTESGRASAELTADEKNARSHRGQALRALVSALSKRQV
ncbi:MAG: XTP/dITP diphosphatase [Gammaproteobacteria bacterium]|nr:XTP/dITP diphosphatase [Gammaproteobacteria bacterium]